MSFSFTVRAPPPKKSGAQSMWATDPDVERLIALRLAAADALGAAAPLLGDVRVKLVAHIGPANTRTVGDLDNYVTGLLDGLQCAVGDSWKGHPSWSHPEVAHVRPDVWCAFEDDVNVVDIAASKQIGSTREPWYEVTIDADDHAADAAWVERAKKHLVGEVIGARFQLRYWLAMRQANHERWFGGSRELQFQAQNGLLTSILLSMRRATDIGKAPNITLVAVLRGMRALSVDEADRLRLRDGIRAAGALREHVAVKHLRQIADKVIAHANPDGLAAAGPLVQPLRAEQYNVATISEALQTITDVYVKYVEPNMASDAMTHPGDPFWRLLPDCGLPVRDYLVMEAFRAPHSEDLDQHWAVVEADAWEAAVATVPKPWPPTVAKADVRHLRGRHSRGEPHLDPSKIAERWGWDLAAACEVYFAFV